MLCNLKKTSPLFVSVWIVRRDSNISFTNIYNRLSKQCPHSTGALDNFHPWLALKMQCGESLGRYNNIAESIPPHSPNVYGLYETRSMGARIAVGILVGFVIVIAVITYLKTRKQKKPGKEDSFWERWRYLFIKSCRRARSQLYPTQSFSNLVNSERSRTLFARDLELEIQRCKCKANGKNRTTTYRPGYLLQATQLFSLSSQVVADIFVQQVIKVIRSYVITAIRYIRSNLVEQGLEEMNNLLKFHRQWIKPALMDWTQGDDVAFQTLFSKLNVRNTLELRTRLVQYSVTDIYRLYLEQYFSSCGKLYTKINEMGNRQALQTFLGINKEEALTAEEYVAGCVYKKAAIRVFENGVIQLERLQYLMELQRFLGTTLNGEKARNIYMETAKPFVVKYLWDIIRDQGITLQQAISQLSYLESTLNIELGAFFTNLQGYENDVELQRKKHTLWKFWTSYKQGLGSQKDSFKATRSEESEQL
ncbi:hypothetical protein GpartN1_g2694.t1 [Galdieria partita]|uniref:Uncharacterized protein n=1 Tax=Galdieria partita TaxID=83374 RepID=A0A9C7PU78_9RHOD|nr:hypothetical protein GpartN1_g2694.t1 [Galdieria partita]